MRVGARVVVGVLDCILLVQAGIPLLVPGSVFVLARLEQFGCRMETVDGHAQIHLEFRFGNDFAIVDCSPLNILLHLHRHVQAFDSDDRILLISKALQECTWLIS